MHPGPVSGPFGDQPEINLSQEVRTNEEAAREAQWGMGGQQARLDRRDGKRRPHKRARRSTSSLYKKKLPARELGDK